MSNTVQYTDMKDSGIKWIGSVPASWNVRTLYQLVTRVNNKNSDLAEQNLLSLSYGKIKRKDINTNDGLLPASFDGYNIIEAGDIVLRLTDLQNDHASLRVGQATERGIITSAYTTLRPINPAHSRYLYYLIHAFDLKKGFYGMGSGVRQGLNYDEVKELRVVLPSQKQQNTIVDYLDDQCTRIDEWIAEAKASIEEFKIWKQSIISEAVTGGITPDVSMKESATEWATEIPRNWTTIRLKNIASSMFKGSGITKEDVVFDGDTYCVRYGEIYSKYNYYFRECLTRTNEDRISSKRYFSYGDILFAGTGESVEEIGKNIAYLGNVPCLAGGDIIVVSHEQNPVFLSFALNSNYGQTQKGRGKSKLKVVHISASDIGNLIVFLPPIDEQNRIADYLMERCSVIDASISEKQELITELELYKRSLIYETVTGKRKVV